MRWQFSALKTVSTVIHCEDSNRQCLQVVTHTLLFISVQPHHTVTDSVYLKCNLSELYSTEFVAPDSMSRAPRVKINNNLQVAVCLRAGWLIRRVQSLWKCSQAHERPVLSCFWGLNQRLALQKK